MKILFRNLFRDIKKSKGQFISILIIVVLGVSFYTSLNSMFRNLSNSSSKYYEEYRLADIWVDIYKSPESVKKYIEDLPNIQKVTERIVKDASVNISNENATLRFITLPNVKEDILNDIVIKSGRYFSEEDDNQCLLDEDFFKANDLKLGDYIYPIINGNEVKLKIIASVKSPEYVYTLRDSSEIMPDNKKFGIIYVKKSFGEAVFDFKGSINNISVKLLDTTKIESSKDDIKRALKNYGISGIIDRDEQTSTMIIQDEIEKMQAMGSSFPIIFFIVASVIIYIMMSRMVENQRGQIGVLKALGFSNLQVLIYYMSYAAIISISGSIIGSVIGTYMGIGLTTFINQYFNLPLAKTEIYLDLVIPASILTLTFSLFAGYHSCKSVFKIMPSEAMREKSPEIGKKTVIEKVNLIWKHTSNLEKIVIRNIFRYKKRAFLTSIGIIFSTAILLIALTMKDSTDFMIEQQYGSIQDYDIKVKFSSLISTNELDSIKTIEHVKDVEAILETGIEISNGWKSKNIELTALINEPKIYKVVNNHGENINMPKNGILIPDRLADTLSVDINDNVNIKFFLPGKAPKEVLVKGIIAQYVGSSAYTSMDNLNNLLGEGMIASSAVLKLDSSNSENEVKKYLRDMKGVTSVESKADSYNAFIKTMAAMKASIGSLIVLSAVLLMAVLYNIAAINIFERQRELATLKVLGFHNNEIKKIIFNENYIIVSFAILFGIPLGNWLGKYIIVASSTDSYTIPHVISLKSYVITIILTLAFAIITNSILMKKIKSINMLEVLKNKE